MTEPLHRVGMYRPGPATFEADHVLWNYAGPVDPARLERQYGEFARCVAASGAEIEWIDGVTQAPGVSATGPGGTASDLGDAASEPVHAAGEPGGTASAPGHAAGGLGGAPEPPANVKGAPDSAPIHQLADAIFPFDPSFMTPGGAILLRPGKKLRRPEAALHRDFYVKLGIPVMGEVVAPGVAEGGDLCWIDRHNLAAGRGYRTNQAGIDQLGAILAPLGVELHSFDLPSWKGSAACLHLLSLVSPLDSDLALVYPRLIPVAFAGLLRECGIACLEANDEEFLESGGLNVNVLAIGPRRCIAINGFPRTLHLMNKAGCDVTCFDGDALCQVCEGGPTCLTLPLLRGPENPCATPADGTRLAGPRAAELPQQAP